MVSHDTEGKAAAAAAILQVFWVTEVAGEVLQDAHQKLLFRPAEDEDLFAVLTLLLEQVEGHIR